MKIVQIFILLLFCCVGIISGCNQEPDGSALEPEIIEWKLLPEFISFVQRGYNLIPGENELKVYGENSCSVISPQNEVRHCVSFPQGSQYKFPASNLIKFHGEKHSPLISVSQWCCEPNPTSIVYDFSEDSLFDAILYNESFRGRVNTIGYDGGFTFLIPARGKDMHPLFYLLALDTTQFIGGDFELNIGSISRIMIEEESILMEMVNIEFLNGAYWVSFYDRSQPGIGDRTYRISRDGKYEKIVERAFNDMFLYEDKLYATSQRSIYEAPISGVNWVEKHQFSDAIVSQVSFTEIQGEICFYGSGILGKINWSDQENTTLQPLINEGLQDKVITSIAEFQDKVYVATYSGLFWVEMNKLGLGQ